MMLNNKLRAAGLAVLLAGIGAGGFLAGRAGADQPHMQKALDSLRDARQELQQATADKGGHREKATDLVRDAIDEVEKGIKYDRSNTDEREKRKRRD